MVGTVDPVECIADCKTRTAEGAVVGMELLGTGMGGEMAVHPAHCLSFLVQE